jgi:predicted TPR repeat methyltransferase
MSLSSTTESARLTVDENPVATAQTWLAQGRARDAVVLLEDLLARGSGGLLARLTLVKALLASGATEQAIALARDSTHLNPDAAPAAAALGEALLAAGHLPTAIGELQRSLRLDPGLGEARYLLGCAWLDAGEMEKALDAFHDADDDAAPDLQRKIDEAELARRRPRCDSRYVRHLFDQFSLDYDARMLGQLSYSAPSILRQLAALLGIGPDRRHAVLDLGCGTGLAGMAFEDLAGKLHGVDLSPAMIERAQGRRIYDTLEVGDVETMLAATGRAYDLILAADTLVYLGDLSKVFAGAAKSLLPGGMFLFTVEASQTAGFELGPKRRWRHSEAYLRAEADRANLDMAGFIACQPRSEAGQPVEGFAVALAGGARR